MMLNTVTVQKYCWIMELKKLLNLNFRNNGKMIKLSQSCMGASFWKEREDELAFILKYSRGKSLVLSVSVLWYKAIHSVILQIIFPSLLHVRLWDLHRRFLTATSCMASTYNNATTSEFSRNTQSWQCWHFCKTFKGNKLGMVTSRINLNVNLHLLWGFEIK